METRTANISCLKWVTSGTVIERHWNEAALSRTEVNINLISKTFELSFSLSSLSLSRSLLHPLMNVYWNRLICVAVFHVWEFFTSEILLIGFFSFV